MVKSAVENFDYIRNKMQSKPRAPKCINKKFMDNKMALIMHLHENKIPLPNFEVQPVALPIQDIDDIETNKHTCLADSIASTLMGNHDICMRK